MVHKHRNTHHVVGFLLGIVLMGGVLGGISGRLGGAAVQDADALNFDLLFGDPGATRTRQLQERMGKRRLRREKRLESNERLVSDIGVTYPMQTNALQRHLLSKQWEVALNTGFLSYPRLGIAAPVAKPSLANWKNRNWRALEDQMQFGLLYGVVAYPHSPSPGGEGNIVIAGHSSPPTIEAMGSPYKDAFAELPQARIGDLVEMRDERNVPFVYRVVSSREIPATQTDILLQDRGKRRMTIFTCYPIGTTRNRWAVELELVSGGTEVAGG